MKNKKNIKNGRTQAEWDELIGDGIITRSKQPEEITNWQKVLIYLDENKDKHFTDQIAHLMEIYNLTNKNK